jgi:hypothetical protein
MAAAVLNRYVLPKLFTRSRAGGTDLLGALAWCFLIGEIAESCICRAKWVRWWPASRCRHFPMRWMSRQVTTLRAFFITLFFVALGMAVDTPSVIGLALIIAGFTVVNRW